MRKYENKTVTVQKETLVGVVCDECGCEELDSEIVENEWEYVVTSHSNWGNDSHESFESFDVCSGKCYLVTLRKFIEANKGDSDYLNAGEVDGKDFKFMMQLVDAVDENE
jgi:hypothetical protein